MPIEADLFRTILHEKFIEILLYGGQYGAWLLYFPTGTGWSFVAVELY